METKRDEWLQKGVGAQPIFISWGKDPLRDGGDGSGPMNKESWGWDCQVMDQTIRQPTFLTKIPQHKYIIKIVYSFCLVKEKRKEKKI